MFFIFNSNFIIASSYLYLSIFYLIEYYRQNKKLYTEPTFSNKHIKILNTHYTKFINRIHVHDKHNNCEFYQVVKVFLFSKQPHKQKESQTFSKEFIVSKKSLYPFKKLYSIVKFQCLFNFC